MVINSREKTPSITKILYLDNDKDYNTYLKILSETYRNKINLITSRNEELNPVLLRRLLDGISVVESFETLDVDATPNDKSEVNYILEQDGLEEFNKRFNPHLNV